MAIGMRMRAAADGQIRILMTHPSENGLRKDAKSGQLVPAHFVRHLNVDVNGKRVLSGLLGGGISKDPYLTFKVRSLKSGDTVRASAEDNQGDTGTVEATVG